MSWSALDWASKQVTGNPNRKSVLITLANFADEENKCFPSIKTIMKMQTFYLYQVILQYHLQK